MPPLRTKTGCLTCRKRRKKCDETRDRCTNCTRNDLACAWPTKDQEKDRRHLTRLQKASLSTGDQATSNDSPPNLDTFIDDLFSFEDFPIEPMHPPGLFIQSTIPDSPGTEAPTYTSLLNSFIHDFLPSRIHPRSQARFFDFSYTHLLALSYQPLADACVACAINAFGIRFHIAEPRIQADQYYSRSMGSLRQTIQDSQCEGDEDWLLATVVILCLYENGKSGYSPASAAVHIGAAGQVFRKRALTKMSAAAKGSYTNHLDKDMQTSSALIFERVYSEAFLYHSMVMSVHNIQFAPLLDPMLRGIFDTYFGNCALPTSLGLEDWPILGMHYGIVRSFYDLLAAIDTSNVAGELGDVSILEDVIAQLDDWETKISAMEDRLHIVLYISAAKLLAYHHLPIESPSYQHIAMLIPAELEKCMGALVNIDVTEKAFTRYFNWPLAIVDRVVQDPQATNLVEQKLHDMARADPDGRRVFEWVAQGFEKIFRPRANSRQIDI